MKRADYVTRTVTETTIIALIANPEDESLKPESFIVHTVVNDLEKAKKVVIGELEGTGKVVVKVISIASAKKLYGVLKSEFNKMAVELVDTEEGDNE